MNPRSDTQSVRRGGIKRGGVTLYCYLMYGFFMYLLTIQGNIIPFLRSELHLSYGAVSLHSSAFAAGGIATGVFGDRLIRRYGRRRALWLGVLGMSAGAAMLCLASAAWASIGSCALMGALGGLIWIVVNAVLTELHGDRRSVAYAEASAVAYACGIVAPLAMSLCLSLSLGWRNAVHLGVAFGGMIVLWLVGRHFPIRPQLPPLAVRACLPCIGPVGARWSWQSPSNSAFCSGRRNFWSTS